ncbi:MAG: DUF6502 family protein [Rhodoferax sp.]|nr:DUF6502 family protein [Rhodoferax sp.]
MSLPPPSPNPTQSVIDEALAIAEPLVLWMIRSGVGYAEFVQAIKPVFLAQARLELERNGQRDSDSAISLLSGLHRKDVRAFREASHQTLARVKEDGSSWGKPSAANQVLTRWLSQEDWGDCIPFSGEAPSFEALARAVSKDFHPRAVLQEMQRLGVASETEGQVQLLREAFVPDAKHKESRELLAGSVADHLAAGVHNLSGATDKKFLEQSVFADGLSPESVQELNLMANALWAQVLQAVMAKAVPLCDRDLHHPAPQRFRLGLFTFSAPEFKAPNTGDDAS